MKERIVLGIVVGLLMTLIVSVVNYVSWAYNYGTLIDSFLINGLLFVPAGIGIVLLATNDKEE